MSVASSSSSFSAESSSPGVGGAEGRVCHVCGADAHGFHFQVVSCRACAAFFRRSVPLESKYKCRRGNFKCDVSKDAFQQCKRCRYQKCRQVGMTLNGLVSSEQPEITDFVPLVPATTSNCIEELRKRRCSSNATKIEFDEKRPHRQKFNADDMKPYMEYFFNENPFSDTYSKYQSSLQCLHHAFKNMVPGGKPSKIDMVEKMDMGLGLHFYGENIIRIAAWAMHCKEFAELPSTDKRKLHVRLWPVMELLERTMRTHEYLGISYSPSVYLLTDSCAVDLNIFEYTEPNFDQEKLRNAIESYKPVSRHFIDACLIPMQRLNPSSMEATYLCMYKLWDIRRVKGLAERTYETAETVLSQISNEIHTYYVTEMRLEQYANRFAKLINLLTDFEGHARFRSNVELTCDVYQILGFEFFDSEFVASDDE
ncbi:hypothetical protein L596_011916 [Steinernema carpocapsae]|uniref:Nuclear receptor domain-containing protein n=1 Tax=Steinernema carpocapsae TaxID=34508 RepID=A0A4U5NWD2_STECR|nr:hypothetical protein L596_011916 [Steinernema carpocapsae]